ncbi:MAG: phosphoribosylaminoimidazolesuccinocarboxamide synthase [Thermodesulfobacteriota bacterium]
MSDVVTETNLAGLGEPYRGKVRDVYDIGSGKLLIVSTDRVSAYDSILPTPIKGKGAALNGISEFWFGRQILENFVGSHFITSDTDEYPDILKPHADILKSRSMIVRKTEPIPVECVVRGYISGSAWREYAETGAVCGNELPAGLELSQKLDAPIFTPSTKAPQGERDENITFEQACEIAGETNMAYVRLASVHIYAAAFEVAFERGFIIADTKFEFGIAENGEILMIDEMFTPDSSRFWKLDTYKSGEPQDSFDKQIVRDYLDSIGWDRKPPAPPLSDEVAEKTSRRYAEMKGVFGG